jgi:hypothetical protein
MKRFFMIVALSLLSFSNALFTTEVTEHKTESTKLLKKFKKGVEKQIEKDRTVEKISSKWQKLSSDLLARERKLQEEANNLDANDVKAKLASLRKITGDKKKLNSTEKADAFCNIVDTLRRLTKIPANKLELPWEEGSSYLIRDKLYDEIVDICKNVVRNLAKLASKAKAKSNLDENEFFKIRVLFNFLTSVAMENRIRGKLFEDSKKLFEQQGVSGEDVEFFKPKESTFFEMLSSSQKDNIIVNCWGPFAVVLGVISLDNPTEIETIDIGFKKPEKGDLTDEAYKKVLQKETEKWRSNIQEKLRASEKAAMKFSSIQDKLKKLGVSEEESLVGNVLLTMGSLAGAAFGMETLYAGGIFSSIKAGFAKFCDHVAGLFVGIAQGVYETFCVPSSYMHDRYISDFISNGWGESVIGPTGFIIDSVVTVVGNIFIGAAHGVMVGASKVREEMRETSEKMSVKGKKYRE